MCQGQIARRQRLRGALPAATGLAVLVLLAGQVGAARASGGLQRRAGNGYAVLIDTRWTDSGGYRPVAFVLTRSKAPTTDTTISIRFQATGFSNYLYSPDVATVEQDVVLPAGSTRVAATLSVPQSTPWNFYQIDFWEDGTYLDKLQIHPVPVPNSQQLWNYEPDATLSILHVDSTSPAAAATPVPLAPMPGGQMVAATLQTTVQGITVAIGPGSVNEQFAQFDLPPARLPESWIDYTSTDAVCLSQDELQTLIQKHPQRWEAIRRWVYAGGNLWVYNVARDWTALPLIYQMVYVGGGLEETARDPRQRGWQPGEYRYTNGQVTGGAGGGFVDVPAGAGTGNNPWNGRGPDFVLQRPLGMGLIVLVAQPRPPQGDTSRWGQVFGTIDPTRRQWFQRNGLSLYRNNDDFWNMLNPGVGLAPVLEFQVLITLFVLVIGPINYFFLRRRGRLHLLILSVPACAALVTLALFAYAVLADGLGTRVRVRSLTVIDQRSREAACWARLSYFAGLAPSGGLTFPTDVAVLPLEAVNGETSGPIRRIDWGRQQRLTEGWIRSRVHVQLLTQRSRETNYRLEITEKPGAPPQLKNLLGADIQHLVLCDSAGTRHWASGLQRAEAAAAAQDGLPGVEAELLAAIKDSEPTLPPNFDYGGAGRRWRGPWGRSLMNATTDTSLMEAGIREAAAWLRPGARMPPRTYVAIVDSSPEVALGVESPSELSGFHVIVGRW